MAEKALLTYTYQEYLGVEARSEGKLEFSKGQIFAMSGGSPEHGLLAANFITVVNNELRAKGKNCGTFSSDVKIFIPQENQGFYPDASIVCGDIQKDPLDSKAIINPILVLDVLSESTQERDRGIKFTQYRKISSFREYVLIRQDEAVVDIFYRTENDLWEIQTVEGLVDKVELKSIGCLLKMKDLYHRVLPT